MKITKERKNLGTLEFTCGGCGTEFTAARDEYKQEITNDMEMVGWKKGLFGIPTDTVIYKVTPIFYVTVICPSCKNEVGISIPTGEKPHNQDRYCG